LAGWGEVVTGIKLQGGKTIVLNEQCHIVFNSLFLFSFESGEEINQLLKKKILKKL
jgi:hypothetical protein